MSKKLSLLIALVICLLANPFNTTATSKYQAAGSHAKSLEFLESKGIPNLASFGRAVTRAEFAMYMVRTLELPEMVSSRTYVDVDAKHPYYTEIQTATAAGIIQGDTVSGKFNPAQPISRIHMVKMLTNALDLLKISASSSKQPIFKDTKGVSADYAKRIATTYNLGIITGDPVKNEFMPFKHATVAQSATFMMRFYNVIDKQNKWYSTADIVSNHLQVKQYFTSFDAAKKALKANQVLLYKDHVQVMPSGIVSFNKYNEMTIESGYTDNDKMAFISGTEATYVSSTKDKVVVQLGQHTQTYNQQEVTLIPNDLATPRSYYTVESGQLMHYIYRHSLSKYEPSYAVGTAPPFLTVGPRYYSVDGSLFYNEKGQLVGRYYNYYQFMPLRVATSYDATVLNEMIDYLLQQAQHTGAKKYKQATSTSKLLGLGATLKEVEATYNINALVLLAMAVHESDYGMNDAAQQRNNIIGSEAVLSKFGKATYPSVAQNIKEMAAYFSDEYVTPYRHHVDTKRKSSYGAVLGSKAVGLNKKYAADAFWGAKISGIYAKLDKQFGEKDANQDIQLAFIQNPGNDILYTRTTANSKGDVAYEYRRFQLPVAIIDEEGLYTKIIADDRRFNEVYVISSVLEPVVTTK